MTKSEQQTFLINSAGILVVSLIPYSFGYRSLALAILGFTVGRQIAFEVLSRHAPRS